MGGLTPFDELVSLASFRDVDKPSMRVVLLERGSISPARIYAALIIAAAIKGGFPIFGRDNETGILVEVPRYMLRIEYLKVSAHGRLTLWSGSDLVWHDLGVPANSADALIAAALEIGKSGHVAVIDNRVWPDDTVTPMVRPRGAA